MKRIANYIIIYLVVRIATIVYTSTVVYLYDEQ